MKEELNYSFEYQGTDVFQTENFDSLTESVKRVLEPQLVEVASVAFRRQLNDEFSIDVANHIRGVDLYISMTNGRADGFAGLKCFPEQGAIYIAGIVKKPSSPSRIIEAIVNNYLDQNKLEIVTVRTQNDRVAEIMANTCPKVVAMDEQVSSEHLSLLERMGLISEGQKLDERNLILRGYFGGPMIAQGDRRRSSDLRVTRFTDKLDYFAGDAMLLVGYRR